MEFGPQSAVESDPWGAVIRFTRWVFRSSGNRGIINMPFDLENQSYVSDKNLRPRGHESRMCLAQGPRLEESSLAEASSKSWRKDNKDNADPLDRPCRIGVDLPLKFLVSQDGSGKVFIPSTAQTTWPTRYCRDTASRRARSY